MDTKEYRETLKLAYPVVAGQLGHIMMGVVDSLMVGSVGTVPLAASSFSNALFFLLLVIGLGFTYAITPYVAMAKSKGDSRKCSTVMNAGAIISLAVGAILFVAVIILSNHTHRFDQPAEVAAQASSYLHIIGWSIIPFIVFQIYRQFAEGLSLMIPAMVITIAANIFNALFNWVFIHGKLGFPAMGLDGAGYSTLFTRTLMAVAMVWYILRSPSLRKYKLRLIPGKPERKSVKRIFKLGLGSGMQYFFEVGAFTGAAVLAGKLGSAPLAAHQVAISLASITYMAGLGVSAAASVRVGNALGRKDLTGARSAGVTAVKLTGTFMGLCGIVFTLMRDVMPTWYSEDLNVIALASPLLIIAALFQISDGVQVVCLGALRGMADAKMPTVIAIFSYWVVGFPAAWYLSLHGNMGVKGIWTGLLIGLTLAAILLFLRFIKITSAENS